MKSFHHVKMTMGPVPFILVGVLLLPVTIHAGMKMIRWTQVGCLSAAIQVSLMGAVETGLTEETRGRIRTDRGVYPEPALARLPSAGGKFNDPVFGTQIMRATDTRDYGAPGCGTFYNQWPTFNSDNTRILIRCGSSGDMLIKAFDPIAFTLGATLRKTPTVKGTSLTWEGAMWSQTDPDLIFVHANGYSPDYSASGMKLYSYRPSINSFTLLKDFAPSLAPGQPDYLWEMHVAQDEIFTFMHKRAKSETNPIFFIVWKRSTNKVLYHLKVDSSFDMNNCNPDKSGRYVYCGPNQPSRDRKIFDLETGRVQTLSWNSNDDPVAHGDLGDGTLIGRGSFSGTYTKRKLSDVHHITGVLFDNKDANGKKDWSNDGHTSAYADNEEWVLLGLYDDPGVTELRMETNAYENELIQISMTDPNKIRRLAHHRSVIDNKTDTSGYWATPKPTISRDGRFISFTSNWGNSGRYDLFIAKVDPLPRLARLSQTRPTVSSGLVRQKRVIPMRPVSSLNTESKIQIHAQDP
jgi:hypothetical protein